MEFSGQYLTYEEYKAIGGTLDQTPFTLLEFEARKKIDERTQGRLKKCTVLPQEVKMCVFALMNKITEYENAETKNKNIASESIDGYSVSYVSGGQIQEIIKSKNAEFEDLIETYLTGVIVNDEHVLFLGVR